MIGQRLGHYEILAQLGVGGMGEVYRARDTTLDREVALKVLPTELASDPERLARFEREAKTLAALNHPSIVTIHTVEAEGETRFLTMELVEGELLSQLIPPAGMTLDRLFAIAIPLADAIAAAHDSGVMHRDLKPANIMVTGDGRVKVLDFGLAKLNEPKPATARSEAVTEPLTREGVVMGTVPYMSPEQLEGADLDARSDIFSLGVILYEMTTGQRPFGGASSVAIISSIVRDSPTEIDQVREDVPRHLGRIIRHCLAKRPELRFQTARDVGNELRDLRDERSVPVAASGIRIAEDRSKRSPVVSLGLLVLAVVAILLGVWVVLQRRFEEPPPALEGEARPRIVVLPFSNLGPPEDEYFADGITEEITSRLSTVAALTVISRTSAVQYKENRPPLSRIGEDLDVDYVLEGSVRWAGGEGGARWIRMTPQLIRVADDSQVWSESYDHRFDDIFTIQSELAEQVLMQLDIALSDNERATLESRPTENLDAYQAYLEGRHLLRQPHFTLESSNRALAELERAVELDPDFVLAWGELARAHSRLVYFKVDASPERLAMANHAIEQAVARSPDTAEVRMAVGFYHLWAQRDADGARRELGVALLQLPNNTDILQGLGEAARMQGHVDDAIAHYTRATELSPLDPSPVVELALSNWGARRFEEAQLACDRAILLAPNGVWPYITKVLNEWNWKGGGTSEARSALEAITRDHPWLPWLWYWQEVYQGRYEEAIERLQASPGDWIRLKICIRPKPLLKAYAHELLLRPEAARAAAQEALTMLDEQVKSHPEDPRYQSSRGIALAKLGRSEEAVRAGKRATELFPLSADAIYAQPYVLDLAHIYLLIGDHDSACRELRLLLSIPGFYSLPLFNSDPRWIDLRDRPCYQRLVEEFATPS